MALYNCSKCPGYCCSYPVIPLTKRDVERLARHHDLSYEDAKSKFPKGWKAIKPYLRLTPQPNK